MRTGKKNAVVAALTACALCFALFGANAQPQSASPEKQKNASPPVPPFPVVPLIAEYEYAPVYFMQWINDSPQYSRIAVSVGDGKMPSHLVVLTEKDSNRNVYYTNTAERAKALKAEGKAVFHTPIDFKEDRKVEQTVTFGVGFRDERGQAVRWRFIPANSNPSKRGAGLQPLAAMPGLHLRYSNLGTAAGAGSAVQIGEKVHEAEPWPQISAPPYFVAYRGSYAHGMELSALLLGKESWRVLKAPSELREGAQWTLAGDHGRERLLQVKQVRGDELIISEQTAPGFEGTTLSLTALLTPQGLALRSITLNSRDRAMRVTFAPELNFAPNAPTARAESAYQIHLGTHEKVSQGVVSVERQANTVNLRWQPSTPDWAKARALHTAINLTPDSYSMEVTQQSK
ncbi:MAG TPA: hypothetical protein VEZ40_05260 [Pyrinomonadaceae bacterium]|nr:hypothetical protein [Pyrinomonadaceae bacterium]